MAKMKNRLQKLDKISSKMIHCFVLVLIIMVVVWIIFELIVGYSTYRNWWLVFEKLMTDLFK